MKDAYLVTDYFSYEVESCEGNVKEYPFESAYAQREVKEVLRTMQLLNKSTYHDCYIAYYDSMSIELLQYFSANKIILVSGMLPQIDDVMRKSKHFFLAERKYLAKSVVMYNQGQSTIDLLNKRIVLSVIKLFRFFIFMFSKYLSQEGSSKFNPVDEMCFVLKLLSMMHKILFKQLEEYVPPSDFKGYMQSLLSFIFQCQEKLLVRDDESVVDFSEHDGTLKVVIGGVLRSLTN